MSQANRPGAGPHRARLGIALTITATFLLVEAVAGFLTGSLVLLADAGHMLTDVAGLSFALIAVHFAQRPATATKTFGYYRVEILAALVNSLLLMGVAGFILFEAIRRFADPPEIASAPLLVVAIFGLIANVASASVLMRGARDSLNVRGAFLEVVGDLGGSLGAIAAGIILITTGWRYADPVFASAVGLFILPRTWNLMSEAIHVLLEGTPPGLDLEGVRRAMLGVPGVRAVHDLHVWTVTSGFVALSGHVEVDAGSNRDSRLLALRDGLRGGYGIDHVTLQIETADLDAQLGQPCLPDGAPCFDGVAPARQEAVR